MAYRIATAGRRLSSRRVGSGKERIKKSMAGGLMMASMLDILMAVLFFLLKNYSTIVSDFSLAQDISLPKSSALIPPISALQLVVSRSHILLDGVEVARITNGDIPRSYLWRDGLTIVKLAQELKRQKEKTKYIQARNDKHSFTGTIVMQADKDLQFKALKKVIYTAGIADFVMLKLAVLKDDAI